MAKATLIIILCICPSYHGDFLLTAFVDRVNRIDPGTGHIDLIHYAKDQIVEAIDFDINHNCLFYAVSQSFSKKIFQKCLNGNQTENVIVDNVKYVSGLSYDWTSELLYFISTKHKIEVVKIVHSKDQAVKVNYMRRTIINDLYEQYWKRDVVVDPVNKYLFWTNANFHSKGIFRSNMDGSYVRTFVNSSFVEAPTSISIDYSSNRIYWLDKINIKIGSCDLNGGSVEKRDLKTWPLVAKNPPITEIAITKNFLFLYNEYTRSIYIGNKDNGRGYKFYTDRRLLSGLKFISAANQPHVDFNTVEHCNCSYICFQNQNQSFICLCPDGMNRTATGECICSNGEHPNADGFCPGKVNDNEFSCSSGDRIPMRFVCNGYRECPDNSDEFCEDHHW